MNDKHHDTCVWIGLMKDVLWHSRPWHKREQLQAYIHKAVYQAIELAQPADLQQLVLEWPHAATGDITKIAYTRDDANGIADRQATVSVGKYLTRHFPTLRDNIIRDIAAKYVMGSFKFVHTMIKMLDVIGNGPSSCMGAKDGNAFRCDGHHPYQAYDPEHGWHMAVYVEADGSYTGRALCNGKVFVRTYRASESTYSSEDDRMRVWLEEQGYTKAHGWDGFRLKYIEVISDDCPFVAPYLDGAHQHVTVDGDTLLIGGSRDGSWECRNQDGTATEVGGATCEDCGDRMCEDDGHWVGRQNDMMVCNHCLENHYVHAYGRGGDQYYINEGDAVYVGDDYYHANYIADNGIVVLENGEYCNDDDAIYIESDSEYYHCDDERICYTVDGEHELVSNCVELENGEYCLEDDAWQCEHSGDWYANSDCDPVTTACGKSIHEDYADEYAAEDEDDTDAQAELFVEQPVVWTPHERGPVETTTKEGE